MQSSFNGLSLVGESFSSENDEQINSIDNLILEGEFGKAFEELLEYLKEPEKMAPLQKIYEYLFQLIPFIDEMGIQTLLNHLPRFIDITAHLIEYQYHFAVKMGERYEQLKDQKGAVYCFGKAIKIAENLIHQPHLLQAHQKASKIIWNSSDKRVTEKYYHAIVQYRDLLKLNSFESEVRHFQNEAIDSLRDLFELFLNDAFANLGSPPCEFDLRGTGALGRGEPSPYPSIEYFILIESAENESYFTNLLKVIELQILSIGETLKDYISITCLQKKRGFRLDSKGNPLVNNLLVGTPQLMASIQMSYMIKTGDPYVNPANRILKSISLLRDKSSKLFIDFQKSTNLLLNIGDKNLRSTRVIEQLNFELSKFRKEWLKSDSITSFDLNERYLRFLSNILSSMALYYKLDETNSLDIVLTLIEKGIFTKRSGDLLTSALAMLYFLRNKIHNFYSESRDDVFLEGISGFILNKNEKDKLATIYWFAIFPLYHAALPSILENGKKIEEVFINVDLFHLSISAIPTEEENLQQFLPLIRIAASYHTPLADHLENIKQLSRSVNLDQLRQAYIQELTQHIKGEELDVLFSISDRSGIRKSTLLKEKEFIGNLDAISTRDFHRDKKTSQIKIVTSRGFRYIKPEIVRDILDESGNLKNQSVVSNGFLFKQQPTYPLMHTAVNNFWNRFTEDLAPISELVRFEVDGCERVYPVLISNNVDGIALHNNWEQLSLSSVQEWKRWTWLLLVSILTKPGNGLLSNYILDNRNFIHCIDNQVSFIEPISQGFTSSVQFFSSPFTLFKDRNLDHTVLEEFCTLDCDAFLSSWIDDVIKKENGYFNLFSKIERKSFFEEKQSFKASILFQKGVLASLRCQFLYLQNQIAHLLRENKRVTPIDLLSFIVILKKEPVLDLRPSKIISQTYAKINPQNFEEMIKSVRLINSSQRNQILFGFAPTFEQYENKAFGSASKAKEELVVKKSTPKSFFASFIGLKEKDQPDLERQSKTLNSIAILFDKHEIKPISVTLHDCAILDSTNIGLFLHEKIEYLDFSSCQNIKNVDIEMIQKNCPNLKTLKINECHGITAIQEGSWRPKPLVFTNLRNLSIQGCHHLRIVSLISSWKIQIEKIENFQFERFEILGGLFINENAEVQPNIAHMQLRDESHSELIFLKSQLLEAVKIDGEQLQYGSDDLKDDPEVVLAAVFQRGEALRHASKRLKSDKKIVLVAVRDFGSALAFANQELQEDFEVVMTAIQRSGLALRYASSRLKQSSVLVMEALKQDAWAFKYVSQELKSDREFILKVVGINGLILQHLSTDFKKDREIVEAAFKQNYRALLFADPELRYDEKFSHEANLN